MADAPRPAILTSFFLSLLVVVAVYLVLIAQGDDALMTYYLDAR